MEIALTKSEGLTPQELRVLKAFRVMDQRHKGEILPHMEYLSRTWPARNASPLPIFEEDILLAAYWGMDRRAKRDTVTFALCMARHHPEPVLSSNPKSTGGES